MTTPNVVIRNVAAHKPYPVCTADILVRTAGFIQRRKGQSLTSSTRWLNAISVAKQ
jgi:hypothetical protein